MTPFLTHLRALCDDPIMFEQEVTPEVVRQMLKVIEAADAMRENHGMFVEGDDVRAEAYDAERATL